MKYLFSLLMCLSILACNKNIDDTKEARLNNLFEDYKDFQYYIYPEYATYNGVHDYDDRLNDQSSETGDAYIDSLKAFKEALLSFNRGELRGDAQVNYDLFLYTLNGVLDEYDFELSHYFYFNQQNGYHITFPQLVGIQPVEIEEEVVKYFSRLRGFPVQAGHIIETLKEGQSKGIMMSCTVSEQVLNQLAGLASMTTEESPLFQLKDQSDVLSAQEDELRDLVENSITPAYQMLYQYFQDNYYPECRTEPGIGSLDGGKTYYEYLVRKFTTTNYSPNEVFDLGMEEVGRIEAEMMVTKDKLGYGDMDLVDFFTHLRTSPEFYFEEKEDLLSGYRVILANMNERLPNLFGNLPQASCDLKEMEAYRAKAAPAAYYYQVPEDGSRPGYFYVNTYKLDSRPKYTMTALALHEAIPGHHLQIALATEMDDIPWFRRQLQVTAYMEGWALYAEYLGYESGMYDDPLQKMGALSFEMWRACRLVVDVGIHYKDWPKEKALDFLRANAPLAELDINSEVDRYISWPGQALGYKIGELRIKALRKKASDALGENFDLRAFHDLILENGNIPLDMLENNVDEWIASQKSS